jgi:hypothetical protein
MCYRAKIEKLKEGIIAFTINIWVIVTIYWINVTKLTKNLIRQETEGHLTLPLPTLLAPSLFLAMRVGSLDR